MLMLMFRKTWTLLVSKRRYKQRGLRNFFAKETISRCDIARPSTSTLLVAWRTS